MKRILFLAITVLLFSLLIVTASARDIRVLLNGEEIVSENKPVEIGGRTMLPVRIIAEAMGCTVTWYDDTQIINIRNATTIVGMQIDNNQVSVLKNIPTKSKNVTIDIPPMLIDDRTYIPVRAFAEALDAVVGWDDATYTVTIDFDMGLKYVDGYKVETFTGTGEKLRRNGTVDKAKFVNPEGIEMAQDGTMYIADDGYIRTIAKDKVDTLVMEQAYATAKVVRVYGNDIYALTRDTDVKSGKGYRAIIKIRDGRAQAVYKRNLVDGYIIDFDITPDGIMYLLVNDMNYGTSKIVRVDINNKYAYLDIKDHAEGGLKAICIGDNNIIYLASGIANAIYTYKPDSGEFKLCAGAEHGAGYVDGINPTFTEPKKLDYDNGYLYIFDHNVVRRMSVDENGNAISVETLAGIPSDEMSITTTNGAGNAVTFQYNNDNMSILARDAVVYLTDSENCVVRKIHCEP